MEKNFYSNLIYLFFLGGITSLSLPPLNYWILNFISLGLFFHFLVKNIHYNKVRFFIFGWIFGFGYFITNLYWISISLTFDKSFKFLIPLSLILIPSFLALFFGLATYIFYFFKNKKIIVQFFLFSLAFGIIEFVRGHIFTGFPWNLIALSFSNQIKILSITSIIGTYGFNLFCFSLFISPTLLFLRKSRKDLTIGILFLLFPIFMYLYGYKHEKSFLKIEKKTNDFVIRAIGSNINLDRFYKNIDPSSIINELIEISDPNLNKKTLFLWPEGIIPDIYQKEMINFKNSFKDHFNENHLIGLGINSRLVNGIDYKLFNSLSIYDNHLNLLYSYNKNNLVPFGEFLPFEKILEKVGFRTITNKYKSFSKGKDRDPIRIKEGEFSLKILPLICYEIIYSGKLYKNHNFDIMVNISEDGWFGKSIGPKQHFAHSIFRAIESGKYLVRSANNGKAAIVNPIGQIEKQIDFGQDGYVDFVEFRKTNPTLFTKFGNLIFLTLVVFYSFLIIVFNRINN